MLLGDGNSWKLIIWMTHSLPALLKLPHHFFMLFSWLVTGELNIFHCGNLTSFVFLVCPSQSASSFVTPSLSLSLFPPSMLISHSFIILLRMMQLYSNCTDRQVNTRLLWKYCIRSQSFTNEKSHILSSFPLCLCRIFDPLMLVRK